MEIEKYAAGKDKGLSSIELQGDSTLLIRWPDGFNSTDGKPNPPREQGYQLADIAAMKKAAEDAVQAAQDALTKAQERVAMFDDLLADVDVHVPQIKANLAAAKAKAEADAKEAAKAASVVLTGAVSA